MIQLLNKLVSPIFLNMGVSQTDIDNYMGKLSGYIYAILLLTAAAIAVMVIAQFAVKKGRRHLVRWGAGLSWVLIVTILANVICFGPMYNNLSPMFNAAKVSPETLAASKEIISEIGQEGMVLVKNDGILPLTDTKNLNVFGWASIDPIFGGTGSGSSDTSSAIGVLQSLESAGFSLNSSLTDMYREYRPSRILEDGGSVIASIIHVDWFLPEPPVDHYTDQLMSGAKEHSDTAVVVLARSGGEGHDLPRDMNAVIHGTYDPRDSCIYENNSPDYDDFDPGEHYLQLTNTEEAMIDKVCANFDKVVVVVNANNPLELGWVEKYPQIGAVILAPGTGVSGMEGLGKILSGEVNPSGRTIDIYLYDQLDTPTINNFGSFLYNNAQEIIDGCTAADKSFQGALSFVNYVENIYVGYKFFETAGADGFLNYEEHVQYPFGYGLSYTTFSQEMQNFKADGDTVSFDVKVTNTGSVAGKDVVEVYYTPPYTNGGIEKSEVNLIQFDKTQLLEPGQDQTIHFDIPKEDMASYDAHGIKVSGSGYILEAGDYNVSIRSDSHTVIDSETFHVASDIDYSTTGRASDVTPATNQFQDYSAGDVAYLSRADGFANYAQVTAAPADSAYALDPENYEAVKAKLVGFYGPSKYDDPNDVMPTTGAKNGLKLAEFTGADYDDPRWEQLLDQLTAEEMADLANLGGFQTIALPSIGKVASLDSDGPAGLNNWYVKVYGTPYPSETLLSQSWNKELAYRVGLAMAQEFADVNGYGWYGPAMNTHRSAFAGRNFEYYSEDGVLAGWIASNVVNAASDKGVYAYIKHFVLNDQETNRNAVIMTWSDEQAIREIYLKPFEIVVKNFDFENKKPAAVMSSFNLIGPIYSGSNPYLLNNVLRGEWGYQGMVLTDWDGSYGYQITDDCVRNGNDIMLGFNSYDSNKLDLSSPTLVKALRQAAKNVLFTFANSGYYTNQTSQGGMDNMTKTFVVIDVVIALIVAAAAAVVLIRYRKKNPKP